MHLLPICYISFILSTLTAPYHFCMGRGVVQEVVFRPEAGIGQGDPFSPVLFSFCVSFVLLQLEKVACSVPFMYADNLCVLIDSKKLSLLLSEICDCQLLGHGPRANHECGHVDSSHNSD